MWSVYVEFKDLKVWYKSFFNEDFAKSCRDYWLKDSTVDSVELEYKEY